MLKFYAYTRHFKDKKQSLPLNLAPRAKLPRSPPLFFIRLPYSQFVCFESLSSMRERYVLFFRSVD